VPSLVFTRLNFEDTPALWISETMAKLAIFSEKEQEVSSRRLGFTDVSSLW
jgi:hypothetical protein